MTRQFDFFINIDLLKKEHIPYEVSKYHIVRNKEESTYNFT